MVFCAIQSGNPVPVIQKDDRTLPDVISCHAIDSFVFGDVTVLEESADLRSEGNS